MTISPAFAHMGQHVGERCPWSMLHHDYSNCFSYSAVIRPARNVLSEACALHVYSKYSGFHASRDIFLDPCAAAKRCPCQSIDQVLIFVDCAPNCGASCWQSVPMNVACQTAGRGTRQVILQTRSNLTEAQCRTSRLADPSTPT